MKITYKKLEKAPENARKVMDELIVVDNSGTSENVLDLFAISNLDNTVYNFTVYPEITHGRLSDLIQAIMSAMYDHTIEGIADSDVSDIFKMLTIIGGKLISNDQNAPSIFKYVDKETKPENKIFFKLMNGRVLYADMTDFNWDMQMKEIENLYQNSDNIMNLIRLTVTSDSVNKVDEKGEVIPDSDKPTLEVINAEIDQFMKAQKLDIDYSQYETDQTTPRELAVIKLIDMLTILKEIILVTTSLGAQRSVVDFYEKKNTETESTESIESIPAADVEVVEEG